MLKFNSVLFVFILSNFVSFSQNNSLGFLNKKKNKIDSLEIQRSKLAAINYQLYDSISRLNYFKDSLSNSLKDVLAEKKIMSEKLKCQKIGEQFWMKQNLAVLKLNNGSQIKEAKTTQEWDDCFKNKIPAYCYHKNDSLKRNGVIYNIHALNSGLLAPKGYRIPTKKEVEDLIASFHSLKDSASFFLKSDDQNTWNKKGLDLFDMNIKPYGFRLSDGVDWYLGDKVYYFCKSEMNDMQSLDLYVFSEFSNKIYFLYRNKETDNVNYGLYVRCIIDK